MRKNTAAVGDVTDLTNNKDVLLTLLCVLCSASMTCLHVCFQRQQKAGVNLLEFQVHRVQNGLQCMSQSSNYVEKE